MNAMTCRVRLEIEQLEARVRGRLAGRVRQLQLLGREDGLILKGQSPTYYGKQLAACRDGSLRSADRRQ